MKVKKWYIQQTHVELFKQQPAPMDNVFIIKGVLLLRNYGPYTGVTYGENFTE